MNLNAVVSRSENFVFNEIEGDLVMMNIESGAYVGLNETGKSIWNLLDTPLSIAEIVSFLIKEYTISQSQCEKEVIVFVEKMMKSEILILG
jgi:hypothetical protein